MEVSPCATCANPTISPSSSATVKPVGSVHMATVMRSAGGMAGYSASISADGSSNISAAHRASSSAVAGRTSTTWTLRRRGDQDPVLSLALGQHERVVGVLHDLV